MGNSTLNTESIFPVVLPVTHRINGPEIRLRKGEPVGSNILGREPDYFAYMRKEGHFSIDLFYSRSFQMRIYAQPALIQYAAYANNITATILETFEEWTGIPYPMPKLGKYPITTGMD